MSIKTTSNKSALSLNALAQSSPLMVRCTECPNFSSRFCTIFLLIGSPSATRTWRFSALDGSGLKAGLFGGYDSPGIAKSLDVIGLDSESLLNPAVSRLLKLSFVL